MTRETWGEPGGHGVLTPLTPAGAHHSRTERCAPRSFSVSAHARTPAWRRVSRFLCDKGLGFCSAGLTRRGASLELWGRSSDGTQRPFPTCSHQTRGDRAGVSPDGPSTGFLKASPCSSVFPECPSEVYERIYFKTGN